MWITKQIFIVKIISLNRILETNAFQLNHKRKIYYQNKNSEFRVDDGDLKTMLEDLESLTTPSTTVQSNQQISEDKRFQWLRPWRWISGLGWGRSKKNSMVELTVQVRGKGLENVTKIQVCKINHNNILPLNSMMKPIFIRAKDLKNITIFEVCSIIHVNFVSISQEKAFGMSHQSQTLRCLWMLRFGIKYCSLNTLDRYSSRFLQDLN